MIDFDPGAPPSIECDEGPPIAIARHFAASPPIAPEHRDLFWYDRGPVLYRGRLHGSAKVLGIASDPGPTERLVGRTLVGDAGQRVQGFLTKLGLTRCCASVNAFPLAAHPSKVSKALPLVSDPDQLARRNRFYDLITDSRPEVIVAFGRTAQAALRLRDTAVDVPTFQIPHPSAHDDADVAATWAAAIPSARAAVTPDPGETRTAPTTKEASPKPTTPRSRAATSPRTTDLDRRRPSGTHRLAPARQHDRTLHHRRRPHPDLAGTQVLEPPARESPRHEPRSPWSRRSSPSPQ